MSLTAMLIAGFLATAGAGEGHAKLIGEETAYSETLLGDMADTLYGFQLTPRAGRVCHIRLFFRGAPPETANYCSGRVTARHMRRASAAVLGVGERLQRIGACFTRDGMIGALRLYTGNGEAVTAEVATCRTEFSEVQCGERWNIQGVQLFFDGNEGGRAHRRLRGVRALCSLMIEED